MKYTIQTKILTGFILGLMSIGLIGYEVHNQMTDLASSLYLKNNRQSKLLAFQKLLSTVSDAESSVRTYSITSNNNDLRLFHTALANLDHYLKALETDIGENKHYIDLQQNIGYKVYLLERMIELKENHPTDDILQEALQEISRLEQLNRTQAKTSGDSEELKKDVEVIIEPDPELKKPHKTPTEEKSIDDNETTDDNNEREKPKGFFQRLFSREKSGPEEHHDDDNLEDSAMASLSGSESEANNDTLSSENESLVLNSEILKKRTVERKNKNADISITRSIEKLKQEKTLEAEVWKQTMLILIKEDTRIMEEIRANILELEKVEMDNNSLFVAAAAKSRNQIISNTKMIAIGAFTIIFILSVVVLNDFRKIRENRLSLIDEKDKANHLARVKEEFLANMSHEIRTPMNAIIGYSELLEKTELTKHQQEFLSTIQQSSSHLLVILNDILDFSKLESGKLKIKSEAFHPLESIDQVVKSMANEAQKKNLNVEVNIKKPIEENLLGDNIRFQQILYNLLSNAIKFTDEGMVKIDVEGKKAGDLYTLKVAVTDEGIGISPKYLEKIFENFEQANTGRERRHGGTGLGLAIVKRLVELQNGNINVQSEEGKGSTFTISIPYSIAEKTEDDIKIRKPENKTSFDYGNLKLLAVDDQEYNLELIKIIIEKWGAHVDLASSGKEAVEKFKNKEYDIILMDVQMPGMSGLEATQTIRKSSVRNGSTIPIVALTAASTKEETDRCLQAGMSAYLLKPFRQKQLRTIIAEQIQHKKEEDTTPEHLEKISYNLENLKSLANGNEAFVRNMLDVFIKNTRHDLRQLEKFVEQENWKSAGYQAHKMIAPSRHLGIKTLADLLEEIENKGINERDVEKLPDLICETKNIARAAIFLLEKEMRKLNENIKQAS